MRHVAAAERDPALPRIQSIQNPYSLLNRTFEVGLAEIALREDVGLLAYAPMAAGTLSGKYLGGAVPEGSRRAIDGRGSRYANPQGDAATKRYVEIARRYGLDPGRMAIAFVLRQPFVTSALVGATSMDQLDNAIDAADLVLGEEVVAELEQVHVEQPNPCP
jgi:aryl-alcohol dehydrogenase-like predicted oxidoreductase